MPRYSCQIISLAAWIAGCLALPATPALARPHPKGKTQTPTPAPRKVVLFDGTAESLKTNWNRGDGSADPDWPIAENAMTVQHGDIVTKQEWGDFHLHLEFATPYMPDAHGQARGNSGVGIQQRYEIQVLDSYGLPDPGRGDTGAVYDEFAPLFNATRPPTEWQTYDILFRMARFDVTGKKTRNAFVTVWLNGICVQNNQELPGPTGIAYGRKEDGKPHPLLLQDHGNAVRYRNVWAIPL